MANIQEQGQVGVGDSCQPVQRRRYRGKSPARNVLYTQLHPALPGIVGEQSTRLAESSQSCPAGVQSGNDIAMRGPQAGGVGDVALQMLHSSSTVCSCRGVERTSGRQMAPQSGTADEQ